jgi:hypothetical protein
MFFGELMMSLVIRTVLWAVASLIMFGTMLAIILANIPVLLVSMLFDRQSFCRIMRNCRPAGDRI